MPIAMAVCYEKRNSVLRKRNNAIMLPRCNICH